MIQEFDPKAAEKIYSFMQETASKSREKSCNSLKNNIFSDTEE